MRAWRRMTSFAASSRLWTMPECLTSTSCSAATQSARMARSNVQSRDMDQHFDAERLAAFADGSLAREERAAAEAHAADCPRCLHLLAAMARTDEPRTARRGFWSM